MKKGGGEGEGELEIGDGGEGEGGECVCVCGRPLEIRCFSHQKLDELNHQQLFIMKKRVGCLSRIPHGGREEGGGG